MTFGETYEIDGGDTNRWNLSKRETYRSRDLLVLCIQQMYHFSGMLRLESFEGATVQAKRKRNRPC